MVEGVERERCDRLGGWGLEIWSTMSYVQFCRCAVVLRTDDLVLLRFFPQMSLP